MSSTQQHNSGPDADGPEVPEPSHAERAKTLVYLQSTGSLSTLSRKQPGLGILRWRWQLANQDGVEVLDLEATSLFKLAGLVQ